MKIIQSIVFAGMLSGVLLVGCKGKDKPVAQTIGPVGVSVQPISGSNNPQGDVQYSSTIEASKSVNLSFQVAGTVLQIPVEVGQYVKKGQLIAEIDQTVYNSQYQAQMAQVRLAKENYDRVQTVYNKGSIAEIKMLDAKANYEQALAASKGVYQNIAHTKLYAPQSGYVGSKQMEVGTTAAPGMPVVTLFNLSSISVHVPIPEGEINKYKTGSKAKVIVPALENQVFEGAVSKIAVLAAQGSPIYTVEVAIANGQNTLRPGMSCNVVFDQVQSKISTAESLLVPEQSVQIDDAGTNFVYVLSPDGKKAVRKNVTIGSLYSNGISVTSGLQQSDQLIVSGFHKITDGSAVTINR